MDIDTVTTTIPLPVCDICFTEFNHHINRPLILIPCCHSFCESCLKIISKKCPTCNCEIKVKSVNWALLNIIPETGVSQKSENKANDSTSNWNKWFIKGNDLFSKKRYKEAVEAFDMAQSIKATFELHYIKGKCYIELKKYLDTINECDKAIELAHNKPKPHYLKGFALYKMRMFERAMKELDFVNTLAPTEFMPYHLKASCLHQLGKYSDAIEYYNRSLVLKPDYYPSINNRKVAMLQIDKMNNEKSSPTHTHAMILRPRKQK